MSNYNRVRTHPTIKWLLRDVENFFGPQDFGRERLLMSEITARRCQTSNSYDLSRRNYLRCMMPNIHHTDPMDPK